MLQPRSKLRTKPCDRAFATLYHLFYDSELYITSIYIWAVMETHRKARGSEVQRRAGYEEE